MSIENQEDKPREPQQFFQDTKKSWAECHKVERLIKLKVQSIQKNMMAAVIETDEVIELLKQLYPKIPKTDGTLFGISPFAPTNVLEQVMELIFRSENKEKNFSRRMKQSRMIDFSKKFDLPTTIDQILAWAFKLEASELEKIV